MVNFARIHGKSRLIGITVGVFSLVWALLTTADSLEESNGSTPNRLGFTNENAPSGVRFRIFLKNQAYDHPELIEEKDYVLLAMGFRPEDLPLLKVYFADLHRQIEQEIDATHSLIACDDAAAALTDERLGALWNSLDDISFGVYAKYVGIANAEMAKLGYSNFVEQLEAMPYHFSVSSFDYRHRAVRRWQEMQRHRVQLCAKWAESTHP